MARMARSAQARPRLARGLAAALTLAAGYALKLGYSRAGADALGFILAPSCFVAGLFGVELAHEPGAGFISHSARLVVGPACAGVNFLLASWLALYFCVEGRPPKPRLRKLLGLSAASLLGAYLSTIALNGLRIALAAQLLSLDIYDAVWTRARVHRLLGVVLYCFALLGLCQLAARSAAGTVRPLTAARSLFTALFLYLGMALGVPLLNRAFVHDPAHFAEHAELTLAGCAGVALLFGAAHRLCSRSRHEQSGSA